LAKDRHDERINPIPSYGGKQGRVWRLFTFSRSRQLTDHDGQGDDRSNDGGHGSNYDWTRS
jgi:hypothetical protein